MERIKTVRSDEIILVEDAAELALQGAEIFREEACYYTELQGEFICALSGGNTPRGMHRRLAGEPYRSVCPWEMTHLFWVDERCLPTGDPRSNFGAARKDLIDRVPLPGANVHPMPTHAAPPAAAAWYEGKLMQFFRKVPPREPIFDLVFLGIGSDGHTASLFPQAIPAAASYKWVVDVKGGEPDVFRLTLCPWVLNRSRHVCFLVSGSLKAAVAKRVLEDSEEALPAAQIQPAGGRLTWILDRPAAEKLDL